MHVHVLTRCIELDESMLVAIHVLDGGETRDMHVKKVAENNSVNGPAIPGQSSRYPAAPQHWRRDKAGSELPATLGKAAPFYYTKSRQRTRVRVKLTKG